MKRRKFVKTFGLATLSTSVLSSFVEAGLLTNARKQSIRNFRSYTLTGFVDEQEECPNIVTNGKDSWLFSLRRMAYPQDSETISVFKMRHGEWVEQKIAADFGKYEHLVASCAPNGKPVLACCQVNDDEWAIKVIDLARKDHPATIKSETGKYINPVLITPKPGKIWLAWECYFKGKFSLYVNKFENGQWSSPQQVTSPSDVCMDPAIEEGPDGDLYLAFGIMDGLHQNIRLKILDGNSMKEKEEVPVAIGGGLKDRINYNTKPGLAFDKSGKLWISWENNRRTTRLEDSDNFTGDRCCGIVAYQDGEILEQEGNKWLFDGKNDHLPTFVKDGYGNLFVFTICGGDFDGQPFWKYRVSWLDPVKGWTVPVVFHEVGKKGQTVKPSVIFSENSFSLATRLETTTRSHINAEEVSVRSKLEIHEFTSPEINDAKYQIKFRKTVTEEYHPNENFYPLISGRGRIDDQGITHRGISYKLVHGNLHEHSNISTCWPAGCDGSLHDDYRYGMYTEGYHFMGMTDHAENAPEVYWRKSLRLAEFYNDPPYFIALPAIEWSLPNGKNKVEIAKGVGHRNIIFRNTQEALKFIKDKEKLYSKRTKEAANAEELLELLHQKKIDCISIPHHPADEVHPTDWNVYYAHYEPVVEIFQCRGNAEYPGCPREINVSRHRPIDNPKAYIDYALREKKYKLAFIASGDHNSIGVGLAALYVKEIHSEEIFESLRSRKCFATTGDKIFIDFRINDAIGGETVATPSKKISISFKVLAIQPIRKVELLCNSKVVRAFEKANNSTEFSHELSVVNEIKDEGICYYYLRVIQKNNHIGWSSPVWVENVV